MTISQQPLHVLIVDHTSAIGGAELSMEAFVRGVDSTRFRIVVALPGSGPMVERLKSNRVDVRLIPLESWRWWVRTRSEFMKFILTSPLQLFSLLRWVSFLRAVKPDLVHFNINRLVEPVVAARLLGIPSVMHFRDIPSHMKLRFVLGRRGFYTIMSLATWWIANSIATGDDIRPHAQHSMKVIPNGIDLVLLDALATSDESTDTRTGAFTVAMVALLVPWKNHVDYVRLASEVCRKRDDVVFLIAGSGDSHYVRELQQLANDLDVRGKVRFLGHVENIPALLRDVDMLLHTTEWEPFGRVFIEAMAARKPVVAFDCGGPAEIVVNGETGVLVPPGKLEEMAQAVCRLLDDPLLRQRMGKAGRNRVEQHFTLEKHCREVEDIYDQVLAGAGI